MKFKSLLIIGITFFVSSCGPSEEDLSKNIITSTIELMGDKYGPGYVTTNGMEGRSHWYFYDDNLEIKYNAVNNLTGKVHNASEDYELINFRRYVNFDDLNETPPTWMVYADWGNAKYWIRIEHFHKNEYNDFFDDEKRSSKDQWALIHNVKWGDGVWAKWMSYLTEEDANKLLEIFKVDTTSEQYKTEFKEHLEEIKEEEEERKRYRISSVLNYFKDPVVNKLSFLTNENYQLIDELGDSVKFSLIDESYDLEQFWNKLIENAIQNFNEIDLEKNSVIVNNTGGLINLRKNDQLIFYKNKDDLKLRFKFLVNNYYDYSEEEYLYRDVKMSNFKDFYGSNNGGRRPTGGFISKGGSEEHLRFLLYKQIFIFLDKNIDKMDIKNVDFNNKVIVFPFFEDEINVIF